MRIANINKAHSVEPILKALAFINDQQKATSYAALQIAKAEACGYLSGLKDARYITQLEFFEYSRQLVDVYSTQKGVLTQ